MAEIATYTCSNYYCGFVVRLSRALHNRSELLCHTCIQTVVQTEDTTCPTCNTSLYVEQIGRSCPRCKEGTLSMPRLSVLF